MKIHTEANITGKVVVITGASSGLGEATARYLAELGAAVVLGARRAARLQALVDEITRAGGKASAVVIDVTDPLQVQALVDAAVETHGRIDVILNNAGVMPHSPLERRKIDDWNRTIDINIKGVLYGIAAALPHMQRQRAGHIINVSSVAGHKVGKNMDQHTVGLPEQHRRPRWRASRWPDRPALLRSQKPHMSASSVPAHLRVSDRIVDLLDHPAFAGFSRFLLPWDDRRYDPKMPLGDIGSLLPYHTHVDPAVVVSSLNRMIDDATTGKRIFYDLSTDTGLFFFRGKPGAPFAVIAPGGGFAYAGSVHEGFPYAVEISKRGYNAFVLKYRAGRGGAVATQNLAAALSYILRHAAALDVTTAGYSLWGSSAGARMAASIGSYGAGRFGGSDLPKPSCLVLLYTGHSDVASTEPPTFVAVGEDDGIAPVAIMERRVAALRKLGTDVEYRKYRGVGHGFGLGTGTTAEGWIGDAVRFWERQIK